MNGETTSPHNGPIYGKYKTGSLVQDFEGEELEDLDQQESNAIIQNKFGFLTSSINELSNKINKINTKMQQLGLDENVIIESIIKPKAWSKPEAKKAILQLFKKEGDLGYSDIIEKLGIGLDLIVEICSELEKSKSIKSLD